MMSQFRKLVIGKSSWKRATLEADTSWQFKFEAQHLDEIFVLLKMLRAAKLKPPYIGREHILAPSLCELMLAIRHEVEEGYGVSRVTGFPVEDFGLGDLESFFWVLGLLVGQPISQNSAGECIAHVVDRGVSYGEANARGYTTRAELVPHCDAGPDFTGLLCVHPSMRGGASTLVSSMAIYNEILTRHPEFLDDLYRGYFHDLRGEGPTGRLDELTNHPIPVYSYYNGHLSCSFNTKSMEQANDKMGTQYSNNQKAGIDYILELAKDPVFRYDMAFQAGDIQFVNNHIVLHSREQYEDFPEQERKRRLLRLWIIQPECRSLDPLYADRFNTGPRGGIARRDDLGRVLPGLSSAAS